MANVHGGEKVEETDICDKAEPSKKVLLLKSCKVDDEYHKYIAKVCAIECVSIPALDFGFKNLDQLKECVINVLEYSGLIFTSAKAVEGLSKSFETIDFQSNQTLLGSLNRTRIFVVGKATRKAALKAFEDIGIQEKAIDCSEAGSAENLANYILTLEDIKRDSRPMLFICGNIAKKTLPCMLESANKEVKSLCVYNTIPNERFTEDFRRFLDAHKDPRVIVFFSPSGAEFHLSTIRDLVNDFQKLKIVTIGQTTANYFIEHGENVHGIAKKPTPESLSHCIKEVLDRIEK